jgi:hypothetical protein
MLMLRITLSAALLIVIPAAALGQWTTIEGYVRYADIEGGCWYLDTGLWQGKFLLFGGGPDLYQNGARAVVWGAPHPEWITICMFGIPFEVMGYDLSGGTGTGWWPPPNCTITPSRPTSRDRVIIQLGGIWPDSCAPYSSVAAVAGTTVAFDVFCMMPPAGCGNITLPWSQTQTVGPLPPGTYSVMATAYRTWPDRYGPAPAGTFTVLRAFRPDRDQDGDVDLTDFALFQLCFNGPNRPAGTSGCEDADFDADADVDLNDFSAFQACFNGPNRPSACP